MPENVEVSKISQDGDSAKFRVNTSGELPDGRNHTYVEVEIDGNHPDNIHISRSELSNEMKKEVKRAISYSLE